MPATHEQVRADERAKVEAEHAAEMEAFKAEVARQVADIKKEIQDTPNGRIKRAQLRRSRRQTSNEEVSGLAHATGGLCNTQQIRGAHTTGAAPAAHT